jgi:hypothetical protein
MISKANPDFWDCLNRLPARVRELAEEKYRLWERDPFHKSLHFKEVSPDIWSVRINRQYRALAYKDEDLIV